MKNGDLSVDIAIIGGSSFYSLFEEPVEVIYESTPFGFPSSEITIGNINNKNVAFLSRHGKGHIFSPTTINYRANIYALKKIGVRKCISVAAVGSLSENIKPGDIILPNQGIDFTKERNSTFFDDGITAHISLAEPFCLNMRNCAYKVLRQFFIDRDITIHQEGTYICIEGPALSSRAESNFFRLLGGDIIGMTLYPEVKLTREAEMGHLAINLVTDYDCWKEDEDNVTVEGVLAILKDNINNIISVMPKLINSIDKEQISPYCENALESALIFNPSQLSQRQWEKYSLFLIKYV